LINYTSFRCNGKKYTAEEEEIIERKIKDLVQECVDFAEESDYPPVQQIYDVVYEQENYPFIPHKL
jgi:pyruvate dehydrogenase E1 component alpha subunit